MGRHRKREERRERLRNSAAPRALSTASSISEKTASAEARPAALRPWLLTGAVALVVARPLVTSDGGPWMGDGEPFAALWLVLVLVWIMGQLSRPRLIFRFTWIDLAVTAFFGWWSIAALIGADHGALRPSYNMLWDGVAAYAAFFLMRQLNPVGREARAIVAAMIGVAIMLSTIGLHQSLVTLRDDRAKMEANPQQALRESGVLDVAPGSPEFELFKSRLATTDALGTFSLTNSLAAFLAPWLIVTIGIPWLAGRESPSRARTWLVAGLCIAAIAATLLYTRSRSAWIAVGVGLVALWIQSAAGPTRRRNWLIAGTIAGIGALAGIAATIIRPTLLEPATRSFSFRVDYWRSTLAMIRDHVWFGCGPGNFGEYYTLYKLPTASEEIKDPHNFLFEVAANAGLPALIALAAVLFGIFLRGRRAASEPLLAGSLSTEKPAAAAWVFAGAAVGVLLAAALNLMLGFSVRIEEMFVGSVLAAVALLLFSPWIERGRLPPSLLATAIGVLLVALLAVGGMTFAGVSGTLWLLAVLLLGATDPPRARRDLPWRATFAGLIIAAALFIFQHQTGYQPVMKCRGAMAAASVSSGRQIEQQLLEAGAADPWAVEPWQTLAAWRLVQWKQSPADKRDPKLLTEYDQYMTDHALAFNPRSAAAWTSAGLGWMEAWRENKTQKAWTEKAARRLFRAAQLYPTNAFIHAELAAALEAGGDTKAAQSSAREALRLDDLMPHADRKLADVLRGPTEQIAGVAAAR